MPRKPDRVPEFAIEGGFINDRTGKKTAEARRRGYRIPEKKGNPALNRFKK